MRVFLIAHLTVILAHAAAVNLAIHRPTAQSSTYRNDPAFGAGKGVDGVKYDSSMFRTETENNPWWEVDLGKVFAIENVIVLNRVSEPRDSVRGLQVLISSDGTNYLLVYTHGSNVFRDRRVDIGGLKARFVRVQVPRRVSLQLQEVEVYQYGTWRPPTQPVRGTPVRITQPGPWFGTGGTSSPSSMSAGNSSTATGATIAGPWSVNFNGYKGSMEFTASGTGWTGRLNLGARDESLTNISFDARTGQIAFRRPAANQQYSGTMTGTRMAGRFNNAYNWSATRAGAARTTTPTSTTSATTSIKSLPSSAATGATITGRWSVNFNGYKGSMEFTASGTGWTGRLNLGARDESLTNISFDARTGQIAFRRPAANQQYSGTMTGTRMAGRFNNAYNWSATR